MPPQAHRPLQLRTATTVTSDVSPGYTDFLTLFVVPVLYKLLMWAEVAVA
jgi:hypothetical protein